MNAMPYSSPLSGHLKCPWDSASLIKVTRKTVPENGATIAEAMQFGWNIEFKLRVTYVGYRRFLTFQI